MQHAAGSSTAAAWPAAGAAVVTPPRRYRIVRLLLLQLVLLQCCSGRLLNNAGPASAPVQPAGPVAGRISIAPVAGRPLAASAPAATAAAAAASANASSFGTVSFVLACAACVDNTASVTVGFQPLWGPGRIGTSGGWVLQGPFRVAAANVSNSDGSNTTAAAVPLIATSLSTFYHHAYCEGAAGGRVSLVASSMTPMGMVDGNSGQCMLGVPMKRATLARQRGDTAVTLTCPASAEQAPGAARSSMQQQRLPVAVVAAAGAAAAVTSSYSTFSLKSDSTCSRCGELRAAVRYRPVAPAAAPGAVPWVTAGWYPVGAQPRLLLATQHREVAFYADCHNRTTNQTITWAGDTPWAVADGGCTSGLKLWTVSLGPRKDYVGTLSCDATTPSMTEDLCAHTVCTPSGPCQVNSTCNPAGGTCVPQYVEAGKPCLSRRGICTAAHTCDMCAGVVCTPTGPCQSNSTCNPADGTCVSEFVAPGQPCLNERGTCSANHTCEACTPSCSHGSCNQETGVCACTPGWSGPACSEELHDPCMNKTCSFQGSCDPSTGACVCNSGWGGDACDKEQVGGSPGACASVNCNSRGVCMEDFEGKPVCVCSWGFLGASCELAGYVGGRDLAPLTEDTIAQVRLVEATFQQQLYPPCCGVDCGTHGTCVGNGTCDCDHGWSGPACAVADPCLTRNCSGHGLCQLGTGGHCSCNHGFYGRDCEIQDPCLGVTCSGHGQCWQGTCACKEGWTGSTCDQLRPGCLVSPVCNSRGTICPKMLRRRRLAEAMKLDAVIVPGGPSLTCTCQRNYKGDACEIDMCANTTCVHGSCSCGDGACGCHCERGWIGASCDVPDPCAGFSCNNAGYCYVAADNTPMCSCLDGWMGSDISYGSCTPLCPRNEACVHGVLCHTLDPPADACVCELDWQGTSCDQVDPMACQPDSCSGHGACSYGPHCTCDAGWTSPNCSQPDPCPPNACSSHGTCQDDGSCICAPGWRGADCSMADAGCSTAPCSGKGVMCNRGSSCSCDAGWLGELCTVADVCLGNDCSGHGVCAWGKCTCDPGHSGPACAERDPCFANDCSGHGHCVFGTGGKCKCDHGWQPSSSNGTDCASRAPTFEELYDCGAWSAPSGASSSGRRLAAVSGPGPTAAASATATSANTTASTTPELCYTVGKKCFLSTYDATSKVSPARSQGNTTMCTSYAALAVAEAALLAAGKGQDLSPKALHFCDAKYARQQPVVNGWWLEEAMKVVGRQYSAALGPAQASCYADSPAQMYPPSSVGDMGGQCSRQLWSRPGSCYKGGLSLVDLTPKAPGDYAAVMAHIHDHGAVATRFAMREGMLRQLKALRVKYGGGVSRFADFPVIRPEGDLRINYIHAAAIIGWDFSGAPNQQASKPRYWIIKDSDPQYPWKWKLATDFTNGASTFANGTGNGVYIAGFVA